MISSKKYVILSLELHLFFARIMKEHSLFLEAGFTPKNSKLAKEANDYKEQFEKILLDTVKLSGGRVRESVIESGEIFTEYTLSTERKTQFYTGIDINTRITEMEKKLDCINDKDIDSRTTKSVRELNNRAMKSLNGLIDLKRRVLDGMLCCKLFTVNYPLLIEHIIREAKLYRSYISNLEMNEDINDEDIRNTELFWDQIMMEHALFIRGLLDPSEEKLIDTSNDLAKNMTDMTMNDITRDTLLQTVKIRDFKKAGTDGIINCKIKSIILPLLADHVLREANHYIRILNNYDD